MTEKPIRAEADFRLYERTARQYDRVRFSGLAGRWGHRRQVEILRNLCDDWRDKRVLEIGCGTGRITEALARWGRSVTATDISREMLEVARSRLREEAGLAMPEFRIMSVFECDLDLRVYDYIIMVNVLGRLSDPGRAIREIGSRMGGQGRLIFTFPCLTSVLLPAALAVNLRGKSLTRDVTSRWYTPGAIRGYCRSGGLEIVRFRGNHYVPVPRLLFPTLPLFWACDKLLGRLFPCRCRAFSSSAGSRNMDQASIDVSPRDVASGTEWRGLRGRRHGMKVSIVTVCFNSADTIEDTIRSVREQEYEHIEHVIVDGGSTDGTQEIVGRYNGRIKKFISEPDRGIYDAMNKGLASGHGRHRRFPECRRCLRLADRHWRRCRRHARGSCRRGLRRPGLRGPA